MIPQNSDAARPSAIGGRAWQERLHRRRRASLDLTAVLRRIDGPDPDQASAAAGCTNWCRSKPAHEIVAAVEIHGTCKCRGWAA